MFLFDADRTHDSLFAQRIKGQILTLLKNAISTRGIFDNPFPFCLIERSAPGALNPWASNWTGKMFEFLKPLSRTFILDDGYLNGSAYGFEPQYTADLPQAIDLEEYHLDRLTVRIAPKSDGVLTWLERTHDEQSASYCAKVTNQIAIAMRRSRVFRNPTNEAQEFELSTRNWLHNSVCFQNCELVGVTANQAKFLLYDNMQNFLDYLTGQLNISPCKVLTGITAKMKLSASIPERNRIYPFNVISSAYNQETLGREIEVSNGIFSTVPSGYHYAYLRQGDTEQGSLTAIFSKNSESFSLDSQYNRDYFQNWDSLRGYSPIYGYELNQLPFENKSYRAINFPLNLPDNEIGVNVCSIKNNINLDINSLNYVETRSTYPPMSLAQLNQAMRPNFPIKNNGVDIGGGIVSRFPVGFYSESMGEYVNVLDYPNSIIMLFQEGDSRLFSESGNWAWSGVYVLNKSQGVDPIYSWSHYFRKELYCLPFLPIDSNLFKSFEIGVFYPDFIISVSQLATGNPELGERTIQSVERAESFADRKGKITINYSDQSALIEPSILFSLEENSITEIFSSTDTNDTSIAYGSTPINYLSESMESTILLKREFRY